MNGRKPKPVEQRRREGNPGRRPLPETVQVGGRPDPSVFAKPPAHLEKEAKAFWKDAVQTLADVGVLDQVDGAALEMLATQYARVRQAQAAVKKHGLFTTGSVGQTREHPALRIEREATAAFMRIAEHFALTPVARTRLGLAELHRRSMAKEMDDSLGPPRLRVVNGSGEESKPRRKAKAS